MFLVQIGVDAVMKMNFSEKKQVLVEKGVEDSDDDAPEKEVEKEENYKELNPLHELMLFDQKNIQTLHKQQENFHLPKGFHNTFSPPPDRQILL